ncbi:MAG: alpha-ketoglutarate-dependent dioxygenase AlkB, partial [Bacteroidota bacterium]
MTDIPIQDGQLLWDPHFFSEAKSDAYFERLQSSINWRQEKIQMFGRWLDQPRLTAWHGDPNAKYTYSSLSWEPEPWTEALQEIREAV